MFRTLLRVLVSLAAGALMYFAFLIVSAVLIGPGSVTAVIAFAGFCLGVWLVWRPRKAKTVVASEAPTSPLPWKR